MTTPNNIVAPTQSEISDNDPPTEIDHFGNKCWKNEEGNLHRDGDLPAIDCASGLKYYYKEGKLHRDDGKPAIEYADGSVEFWENGIKQPERI